MFRMQELEFSQNTLQNWREKYESNSLSQVDIVNFLQSTATQFVYEQKSSTAIGSYNIDEQNVKDIVIDVFEKFICGDDSHIYLERLKLENTFASICGRVFKIGEPTYSCRECITLGELHPF
ncbi:E3 ubiquitin-protein ligase UBR1-like isoform X2 [Malaya genurostris]|uniref:E3 ubiquitin-protein ligase UBR1-like isoform X2 n=1 Tax=Malaya genurostris TaxID=325434 RepID=UPI0026F39CBE|nr:E3 ubiquitin-protein ligase UBR1-like isoform X2 [Malaya genurostris]